MAEGAKSARVITLGAAARDGSRRVSPLPVAQ
jgi:hypothetical protein